MQTMQSKSLLHSAFVLFGTMVAVGGARQVCADQLVATRGDQQNIVSSIIASIHDIGRSKPTSIYEWIEGPKLDWIQEPAHAISETYATTSGGLFRFPVSISRVFEVNESRVDRQAALDLILISDATLHINPSVHLDTNGKSSIYSGQLNLLVEPHSRAYVSFSHKIARIRGRARIQCFGCQNSTETLQPSVSEEDIEIRTSVDLRQTGRPEGDYQLDYVGTNEFLHPEFYNILDKDLPELNDHEILGIRSARHCGELAQKSGFNVATYKVQRMACMLKKVIWGQGQTYNRTGGLLGPFNVQVNLDDYSLDRDAASSWARNKTCDVIYVDSEGRPFCNIYAGSIESSTLMFAQEPEVEQKLVANSPSFGSHPQFHMVPFRDMPQTSDTFHIENVKSACECGDLAVHYDSLLAVYRNNTKVCQFKSITLEVGRSFTGSGKLLGNYDVALYDAMHSQKDSERSKWIEEKKCDIIHDSKFGPFWCKRYAKSRDAVMMFRYREAASWRSLEPR